MKKVRVIIVVIAAIALIAVGFMGARLMSKADEPKISATAIEERLSRCSTLTTSRLDYRGMVTYTDGEIQFITKKSFSMIYDAHIKAGIDLSEAKVKVEGQNIEVVVPKPEIQDIIVDSETLEFYDEQFALFNWTNKTDTAKAIDYARQDAAERAAETDILDQASKQAETVIETFIMPLTTQENNTYYVKFIQE